MGWVSAFSAFGRFSVTLPTRPFRSRMISSLTAAPLLSKAGASYSRALWSARHFAPGMIHVIPASCGRSPKMAGCSGPMPPAGPGSGQRTLPEKEA